MFDKTVIYTCDHIPYILSDNLSQWFLKALISAQKLHCKKNILDEHRQMNIPALKYDHDIIIIKYVESLKLFWYKEAAGRWIDIKIC